MTSPPLPPHFSWRNPDDAARLGLPPRVYASAAIDQHSKGWCGLCYLVAVVQVIQDRIRILEGGIKGTDDVSLQAVADHFQQWRTGDTLSPSPPGWNVCHGGSVWHVLECFERGRCPLLRADGSRGFLGFAQRMYRHHTPTVPYRVTPESSRRLHLALVKEELLSGGPMLLEISYETCKHIDPSTGVATDTSEHPINHSVSVVGWTAANSAAPECWVVRNSWGSNQMPTRLPVDYATCVELNHNACTTTWIPWTGMSSDPGFFLLPCHHPSVHRVPSPWIVLSVEHTNQPKGK